MASGAVGVAIDPDSINSSWKIDDYKECVMSVFYAQIKHEKILFHSIEFNRVVEVNDEIRCGAELISSLIADSDFIFLGYVVLTVKVYFLIGRAGTAGKFVEFPLSQEVVSLLNKSNDEVIKRRLRKALKINDLDLFSIELSKFADEQFERFEH